MSIEKVRMFLEEKNYDGILLRRRNNFSWVTGGNTNYIVQTMEAGVADWIITPEKAYLVTSKMEERRIVEEECRGLSFPFEVLSVDWYTPVDGLIEEVTSNKRMATDMNYSDWDVVDEELSHYRSVLTEGEQERYRNLCQKAAKAVEETCRELEPGQTENEIEAHLASKVLSSGMSIQVLLVATDERIYRYRHPIPTEKKLERHAMLVLCAEEGGLVANVTRLVYFGELPEELRRNSASVAKIDSVMNAATRVGVTAGDVIVAGVNEYANQGFPDDWKLLHQGGLTGYNSREFLANPETTNQVVVNQAYAWNPSLPGVKSEDTILLTEEGIEFMTHTGEWVYQEVEVDGVTFVRPAVLER
ncbi:M24 family metallopeptidase [Guptibacillus hwajinpoensis]|uniref:M24 family metallopeptidase n=1 Tax=Guptibacillus hwajinpoensis TaxID=208199 RepID=UPI003736DAE7